MQNFSKLYNSSLTISFRLAKPPSMNKSTIDNDLKKENECLAYCFSNIKRRCGLIANETTVHKRPKMTQKLTIYNVCFY